MQSIVYILLISEIEYFMLFQSQVTDSDDIKRNLIQQLPYIISNLQKMTEGYTLTRDILIPSVFELLGNDEIDVKKVNS